MKPAGPLKHFISAFVIALVLYAVAYTFIEHRRTRNGPWELRFLSAAGGPPTLVINEPRLRLTNVALAFPGAAAAATNVQLKFSQPREGPYDVPFGQCLFMDTTFLPGTLAFNLFGHQVQLLPRTLTIDRQDYPWRSETTLAITNVPVLTNKTTIVHGPEKALP
jgi:hypothetical protein